MAWATARCRRLRAAGDTDTSTVSRTSEWANWYVGRPPVVAVKRPAATSSSVEVASSSESTSAASPAASARTARSIRCPAIAATSTTERAGVDSRPSRAATTSRTLSGTSLATAIERTTNRFSYSTTAPAATKCRQSSPT